MIKQNTEKIAKNIPKLRNKIPLTHCITNYVTINDCANAVLAIGGSPVMANEAPEIEDFINIAEATVINMGTLLEDQIEPMKIAAKHTKKTDTPLTIDPVAVGLSKLRNDLTKILIDTSNVSVIRGNMSEIKAIANLYDITEDKAVAKGVDVADKDQITDSNLKENALLVKKLAYKINTIIAVSGPLDIITDGKDIYIIDNGNEMMSQITGSGCMLTCIIGAFTAITNPLEAAITATLAMTIAGEQAKEKTKILSEGTGSFRTYLVDYLSLIDEKTINTKANLYKLEE